MRLHGLHARDATVCIAAAAFAATAFATARPVAADPQELSAEQVARQSTGPVDQVLDAPNQWLTNALTSALVTVGQMLLEALHKDVDWALGQDGQGTDFVTRTPAAFSYQSSSVQQLFDTVRAAANLALACVVMWAGYQIMSGPRARSTGSVHTAMEIAPRVLLGAVLVHTSLWWGQLAIDGANGLGSIAGPIDLPGRAAAGDASRTLALVATEFVFWLVALLLVLQQLMRLALVDALLVLAPLGMLLWVPPQTQAWGRLWSDLFLVTVFTQPVQMLVLKLGSLLVGELGGGGPVISMFLAIGVAYLALKVPGMLRSGLVRGGGGMGAGVLAVVLAARQASRAVGVAR